MPHLASLVEEFGKKGLTVLALTDERRDTVLKYMAQLNDAPPTYVVGYGGGASGYPTSEGIPQSFLIGADGKVVWQGHPAELSGKMIEAELKKVRVTDEMRTARAAKALAYAEGLFAKKELLRAVNLLEKVAKDAKAGESAKKASERLAEIAKDEASKRELDAQRTLDKTVGGIETPKEKLKEKERPAKAKALDELAKKWKDAAPASAAMAEDWAKVFRDKWVHE